MHNAHTRHKHTTHTEILTIYKHGLFRGMHMHAKIVSYTYAYAYLYGSFVWTRARMLGFMMRLEDLIRRH